MIQIHPVASIVTALLQLRNGHIEAARCTLHESVHESIAMGEEPDLTIQRAANWLDQAMELEPVARKHFLNEAKALLEAAI